MYRTHRFAWLGVAAVAAVAGSIVAFPAQAGLFAYDGFSYSTVSPGLLNGQNGGTGWGGAWSGPSTAKVETPGSDYNYGALTHIGNVADVGSNASGMFRSLGQTYTTLNNVYWFSVMMDVDVNIGEAYAGMSLFLSTDANKKEKLFVGEDTAHSDWSMELSANTTRAGSGVAIHTQTATLMVVELDGINQQIKLWVNPASLGGAAPGAANATINLTGNEFQFDEIRLAAGGTEIMDADEIRFGTSYADVTPSNAPEPKSSAILALALGTAMLIHRRYAIRL